MMILIGELIACMLIASSLSGSLHAQDITSVPVGVVTDHPGAQRAEYGCPLDGATLLLDPLTSHSGDASTWERVQNVIDDLDNEDYFAVIGPRVEHVAIATEYLDAPYLATDISLVGDFTTVYSVLPDYKDILACVVELTRTFNWTNVAIFWEDDSVADAVAETLDSSMLDFSMFRVPRWFASEQIRESLRIIRRRGIHDVIILTSPQTASIVLNMAMRLGIMAVPYSWLLVHYGNLTSIEGMLEDIETNVTVVELSQTSSTELDNLGIPEYLQEGSYLYVNATIQALLHMCDVIESSNQSNLQGKNLNELSQELPKDRKSVRLKFSPDRRRVGYTWDIYTHNTYSFGRFARWNRGDDPRDRGRLEMIYSGKDRPAISWTEQISVVTIPEQPWVMLKPGVDWSCSGNHCYEGFIVDMMERIAKQFTPRLRYNLYLVPDGAFGSLDPDTGLWNGIMAEIISRNATMSLAPLSINKQREEAVDFTKPFKTRGISVLIKSSVSRSSFFQFLAPLSYQVWLAILAALVVVSLALCTYERHGTSQRRDMLRITERETCWFVFGSLVQEGTESTPVTVGGRILIGSWWFFAMILLSSYTANLAAFLTVKKINTPIETVSDLIGQTKIKYGTVRDSGVLSFFQNTKVEPYRTMWTRMGDDTLVGSTEEGLRRVQEGNYAFIWDNTVNSYIAANDCNYTEIGPSFDPKGYGIGVPSGATYRENLTLAVLALADDGTLDELENTWWQGEDCPTLQTSAQSSDTEELQLENIAGIFFVLLGGLILGGISCILDKYVIARFIRNRCKDGKRQDLEQRNNGALLRKNTTQL